MKEKATRKIFSTLEWNDLGITILLRKGIAIAKGIYYIFQKKTTQYFLFSLKSFFFLNKNTKPTLPGGLPTTPEMPRDATGNI
jgi:hypothetical protein